MGADDFELAAATRRCKAAISSLPPALGLDCGPMSGFDNAKVDAEFFPDGQWKSNFLCPLGEGDPEKLRPRYGSFEFDDVCRIV